MACQIRVFILDKRTMLCYQAFGAGFILVKLCFVIKRLMMFRELYIFIKRLRDSGDAEFAFE